MRIIRFEGNGWRARFDDGFDDVNVRRVGHALGILWNETQPGATILVGYDARHAGFELAWRLGEALASHGLAAKVSSDLCPAPALWWAVAHDPSCIGGVMLTAHDSPCEYGGLVVCGPDGGPAPASFVTRLEREISAETGPGDIPPTLCSFVNEYVDAVLSYIDIDILASARLEVVADPMHGACVHVLPMLLERAGCDGAIIHAEPDQNFGDLHPRAADPWVDACEQAVVSKGAACGLAVDGDGSRCALIDARGKMVSPHDLVPFVMRRLVERGETRDRVVITLASSERMAREAKVLGCAVTRVPIGFDRAYGEIAEGDVLLAADEVGGICVPGFLPERDGLVAGLLALERVAHEGLPLRELIKRQHAEIGRTSYGRKDLRLEAGEVQSMRNVLPGLNPQKVAGKKPVGVNHADGLRLEFETGAWVLVRPSRTEPIVRAYCEANTSEERDALLKAAVRIAREGI